GWLFVAALAGVWAIGRVLAPPDRTMVETAVILGVLVNSAVALWQTAFNLRSWHLDLVANRAPGLTGNPVHMGALAAAVIALMAPRLVDRPWRWALPIVLASAAAQVSGTRAALVVLVVLTLVLAAGRRGRFAVLLVGLVGAGLLAGWAISRAGDH